MSLFTKHSCGDSRLACVECSAQICPKCMIPCPVGNRCKACADKTASHTVKVTPAILLRTGAAALAVGALFGYCSGSLSLFGFYSWIILYALGIFIGNLLHKVSGYKMGKTITLVVGCCLVAASITTAWCNPRYSAARLTSQQLATAMQDAGEDEDNAPASNTGTKATDKQAVDNGSGSATDQPATNTGVHHKRKLSPQQLMAVQQSMEQARAAMFVPSLISLAIFTFGVISPFANIAPITFGRFRR